MQNRKLADQIAFSDIKHKMLGAKFCDEEIKCFLFLLPTCSWSVESYMIFLLWLWLWLLGFACIFSHWRSIQFNSIQFSTIHSNPIQSNPIQSNPVWPHPPFFGGDLYKHKEFKSLGSWHTRLSTAQLIKYLDSGAISLPLCFYWGPRDLVFRHLSASCILLL